MGNPRSPPGVFLGMRKPSLACTLLLCAACGSGSDVDLDAGGPAPDAAPPGEITGTNMVHHLADGVTVPVDMSAWSIEALVPGPTGYTTFPGVGRVGGTFSIPDVPGVGYVLATNNLPGFGLTRYRSTFERVHMLDRTVVYRSDAVRPMNDTHLIIDATGLSAWQPTDMLFLFSETAGAATYPFEGIDATNFPAAGETALVDLTVNFRRGFRPRLVDGTRGDVMFLTQLVTRPSPIGDYQTPARSAELPSFTMTDGMDTSVMVDLPVIPDDDSIALDWPLSEWQAQAAAVHPDAVFDTALFALQSFPRWVEHGVSINIAPDLLVFYAPAGAGDLAATLTYGDPYPAEWDRFGDYRVFFRVEYAVPGSSIPVELSGGLSWWMDYSVPPSSPVGVQVTPPRSITVDTANQTVSWDAPTILPAEHSYQVTVHTISAGSASAVASFDTTETTVTFPSGTIANGVPSVVEVTVVAGSRANGGHAIAFSDLISP